MKCAVLASAVIVMVVARAVAGIAAVSGPGACTLVGCEDGITVYFWKPVPPREKPLYVRFCAAGKCEQARVAGRRAAVDLPCPEFDGEGTVEVTGRVLGRHAEVLSTATREVRIRRLEPNGQECGPTCWVGHVGFSIRERRFVPFEVAQQAISRRY